MNADLATTLSSLVNYMNIMSSLKAAASTHNSPLTQSHRKPQPLSLETLPIEIQMLIYLYATPRQELNGYGQSMLDICTISTFDLQSGMIWRQRYKRVDRNSVMFDFTQHITAFVGWNFHGTEELQLLATCRLSRLVNLETWRKDIQAIDETKEFDGTPLRGGSVALGYRQKAKREIVYVFEVLIG